MAGRLDGKVALITGAARGQGAAEARLFAAEGARVVLTDILDETGRATAASIGPAARYLNQDVRDEARWRVVVEDVVATEGRLDILVNNAGVFPAGDLLGTRLAEFEQVVSINLTGVFLGMQAAASAMLDQGSGSIVNISSIAGLAGSPMHIGYGVTKWGLRGLTRSAARQLAASGVRVNSVHPGLIDTQMLETIGAPGSAARQGADARIPMQREGTVDDVARVVLFLASDEAAYVTGAEYAVDGGWMS
ncbi:MAG: glucose 1-dehydrogenase [Burkholderiaceae bacterium]